jgi:hypothetical protein
LILNLLSPGQDTDEFNYAAGQFDQFVQQDLVDRGEIKARLVQHALLESRRESLPEAEKAEEHEHLK